MKREFFKNVFTASRHAEINSIDPHSPNNVSNNSIRNNKENQSSEIHMDSNRKIIPRFLVK